MPMMNSEARKRAADHVPTLSAERTVEPAVEQDAQPSLTPTGAVDPRVVAARLADAWDQQADAEDARGNGFAAVILHAHARDLRSALALPLSA